MCQIIIQFLLKPVHSQSLLSLFHPNPDYPIHSTPCRYFTPWSHDDSD